MPAGMRNHPLRRPHGEVHKAVDLRKDKVSDHFPYFVKVKMK